MKTLLICLDGLGYSMLSEENTPFLCRFAKSHSSAKLKTLFAFSGIPFSFYSGEYPDKLDIWLEFSYSPSTSPFRWQKHFSFLGRKTLSFLSIIHQYMKGRDFLLPLHNMPFDKMGYFDACSAKNIWHCGMFKGTTYASYKWPFFTINRRRKIIWKRESDFQRCQRLEGSMGESIDLYDIQLLELDRACHRHGRDSPEAEKAMRGMDRLVEGLVGSFAKRFPGIRIVIWSDHGFVPVKGFVDMQAMMPKGDYVAFYGGTTASFWFRESRMRETIAEKLETFKFGQILAKEDLLKYHIPQSRRHGDLIFSMNPGLMIHPNYYQRKQRFRAMHGYPVDKCDSDGVLITNIPIKKKAVEMPEVMEILR